MIFAVLRRTYRIAVPRKDLSAATQWMLRSFPIEELRMEEVDLTEVIEKAFAMESRA
ncbi:MAG: hypothetical protein PHN33_00740 [Candidatus Peribacteraceae bacterium]|nr:hypothetical protein [Candidatus Peribacteraceae bacterium]